MIARYLSRIRSFFGGRRRLFKSRRPVRPFRRWHLHCETLEDRCVPTQGAFLQGFTFIDANHNGIFDSGEGQPGASVRLFAADLATAHKYSPSADLNTVLGSVTSDALGYYLLNDSNVLNGNLFP